VKIGRRDFWFWKGKLCERVSKLREK